MAGTIPNGGVTEQQLEERFCVNHTYVPYNFQITVPQSESSKILQKLQNQPAYTTVWRTESIRR